MPQERRGLAAPRSASPPRPTSTAARTNSDTLSAPVTGGVTVVEGSVGATDVFPEPVPEPPGCVVPGATLVGETTPPPPVVGGGDVVAPDGLVVDAPGPVVVAASVVGTTAVGAT